MKCLICYEPLKPQETDYHLKCIASVFGLKQDEAAVGTS